MFNPLSMGTNGYTNGYTNNQWVYQWVPMGTNGYQWVPMGINGYFINGFFFFNFFLIDQIKTYFLRYLKKNFFLVEWFNKIGGIINTI